MADAQWQMEAVPCQSCGRLMSVLGDYAGMKVVADDSMPEDEIAIRHSAICNDCSPRFATHDNLRGEQ